MDRLESKDLPSLQRLGRGLSGFVYETEWKGNRYARKDFPIGAHEHNSLFEKEARPLHNIDHPNIVKCYGYTVGGSSCSLVQEFVDDNIQDIVQRRVEAQIETAPPSNEASSSKTPRSRRMVPFEVSEAVDITSQIATGMQYLHEHGVAHGGLKPKNVLAYLDSDVCGPGKMIVKVADFGFVQTKSHIKLVSKRARQYEGLMWKAPELYDELDLDLSDSHDSDEDDDEFDEDDVQEEVDGKGTETSHTLKGVRSRLAMADVYSFGLTCSHILSARLWYPKLSLRELREQRRKDFRLDLPIVNCLEYLNWIIGLCLDRNPLRRPTFSTICSMIDFFRSAPELFNVLKDTFEPNVVKGYDFEDIISTTTTLFVKDSYKDSSGDWSKLTCLPHGIGKLTALETLDVSSCSNLEELPEEIGNLTSFTSLWLRECLQLKGLPHGIGKLTTLKTLIVSFCPNLEELPEEIGNLTSVTSLSLSRCSKLKGLPHGIGKLMALKTLDVSRCSNLEELPEEIGNLTSVTSLSLSGCLKLKGLPHGIGKLTALKTLAVSYCPNLEELPEEIGNLTSVTSLLLSGCSKLKGLPHSIVKLTALETLDLSRCSSLEEIGILNSLLNVEIRGLCRSQRTLLKSKDFVEIKMLT